MGSMPSEKMDSHSRRAQERPLESSGLKLLGTSAVCNVSQISLATDEPSEPPPPYEERSSLQVITDWAIRVSEAHVNTDFSSSDCRPSIFCCCKSPTGADSNLAATGMVGNDKHDETSSIASCLSDDCSPSEGSSLFDLANHPSHASLSSPPPSYQQDADCNRHSPSSSVITGALQNTFGKAVSAVQDSQKSTDVSASHDGLGIACPGRRGAPFQIPSHRS